MTRRIPLFTMCLILGLTSTARATVLTFDVLKNGNAIPVATESFQTTAPLTQYGDNVDFGVAVSGTDNIPSGPDTYNFSYDIGNGWTPNVAVAYSNTSSGDQLLYDGDAWPQSVNYLSGASDFLLTFTPDANFETRVNSFRLWDYQNGGVPHTVDWALFQDANNNGTPIASGQVAVGSGGAFTDVTTLAPFYQGTVVLRLTHTVGATNDLAIELVNFDQQFVPEPSACFLLGLACMSLVHVRRRHGKRYE